MDALANTWWAWAAFALVLAILEVLAPGFVLLGFAIGAALV
ncbi:NfeD family protein, partial [Nereida ignava]